MLRKQMSNGLKIDMFFKVLRLTIVKRISRSMAGVSPLLKARFPFCPAQGILEKPVNENYCF